MSSEASDVMYHILWRHRWRLLVSSVVGVMIAATYFLLSDKMYVAELIAVPASHDPLSASNSGIGQAFGSLGALAGLGTATSGDSREALAILRSRSLLEQFILEENLLPQLFPEKWDESEKQWLPEKDPPSLWDGYRGFSRDVVSVSDNASAGTISLKITWTDPEVAAKWANSLMARANARIRANAIDEASSSMQYLRQELENTSLVEVRESIFSLLESQVRKIMLANTRPDYAFKIIDEAKGKDLDSHDYPQVSVLLPVGAVVGPAVYLLIVLVGVLFAATEEESDSTQGRE